jgi:hypothetical protein
LGDQKRELLAGCSSHDVIEVDRLLRVDPPAEVPSLDDPVGTVDVPDESHRPRKRAGPWRVGIELVSVVSNGPAWIFAVDDVELEVDLVGAVLGWLAAAVLRIVVWIIQSKEYTRAFRRGMNPTTPPQATVDK